MPIYPIARRCQRVGNRVVTNTGIRNKGIPIRGRKWDTMSDKRVVCTDDGSYRRMGWVSDLPDRRLDAGRGVDPLPVFGLADAIRFFAVTTEPFAMSATTSLNSNMADGTGMRPLPR